MDAWTVPNQTDYLVVDDGRVSGVVSTSGLRSIRRSSRAKALLRDVLRESHLAAWPDEPIHDALERMTNATQSVIPVLDRESGRLQGSVASQDVIDLILLMEEIEAELKEKGPG